MKKLMIIAMSAFFTIGIASGIYEIGYNLGYRVGYFEGRIREKIENISTDFNKSPLNEILK